MAPVWAESDQLKYINLSDSYTHDNDGPSVVDGLVGEALLVGGEVLRCEVERG
jgi:hypothetical protein